MFIKDLRTAKGIPQREFGEALGVDRTTVAKWETGKAAPRADMLPRIAKLLGCTVGDLFGEGKEDAT